jgi:hypothetical protein
LRRIWRSIIILGFGIRILVGAEPPQGFFLYDFQPKKATVPPFKEVTLTQSRSTVTVEIDIGDTLTKVPKYIYGHNANVYMTQMVNEPTLIGYIKQLAPQILRYPGGNLSNLFFWNNRPSQLPEDVPNPLYGGVEKPYREEFWFGRNDTAITLSVDNYYKMLEMTNCTGIICVNYSYARYGKGENPVATAAKYATDWVRYDNGRTKFWEIGNENFGNWQAGYKINTADNKDGQPEIITGELYGKHFKVFADSMRAAARSIGVEIKLGAGLLESAQDWHTPTEKTWNSGFFKQAGDAADFFVIHSYYTPWNENSSAGTILNSAIPVTQEMMTFMQETARINEVKMKPVGLTEWNIFAVGSKQQVSYINGIHAVLVLGELIKNKYGLACRWNLANNWNDGNDHGMFSQSGEPNVSRWNPRPVFYYMTYFQQFCGDHLVNTNVVGDSDVVAYASSFSSGEAGIILVNKGNSPKSARLEFANFQPGRRCYWYLLTGGKDNGDFSLQVFINGVGPELPAGGSANFEKIKAYSTRITKPLVFDLPPYSVLYLLVESDRKIPLK